MVAAAPTALLLAPHGQQPAHRPHLAPPAAFEVVQLGFGSGGGGAGAGGLLLIYYLGAHHALRSRGLLAPAAPGAAGRGGGGGGGAAADAALPPRPAGHSAAGVALLQAPWLSWGTSPRGLGDDDFHFVQCSNEPVFNVTDVAINPNPAVHGQDIYVSLTGNNTREVTGATLSVTIYYRGWPVQRQSRDICGGERPVTPACPFEPGNLTITSSDYVPIVAPPGPYSMRMQAWDQNQVGVMCIDIWFRVVTSPSAPAAAAAAARAADAVAGAAAGALWRLAGLAGGGGGGGAGWQGPQQLKPEQGRRIWPGRGAGFGAAV
ncbi:hypothetical protein Rsub_05791 [Raphidocelis subcapitata]|uniref:MD-2-related lipid-recognition domain-containing protein n=1 Tax=Raphidocelis subcapitata TaxID=307507 RepID=A0A2V0P792_9CHLO|nr:hypothetical protein Rsub_05791 [Raphidocelis subcapitata]|eukprot:GBF92955.1 hypothetical protein Rsub_05791 [Raphidocelis subcapitata]